VAAVVLALSARAGHPFNDLWRLESAADAGDDPQSGIPASGCTGRQIRRARGAPVGPSELE
jgi:hypothetical protein